MSPLRLRSSTILLALGALGSTAACSAAPESKTENVATGEAASKSNPKVLLGVGNSITFGFQAELLVPPFTPPTTGPVDLVAGRHKKTIAVNFAVPGETSTSLVSGPPAPYASVFPLHDALTAPTQLATAEDYLANNPGRTHGIVVDVGGNDLLALVSGCGTEDYAAFVQCLTDNLPGTVATLKTNLRTILTRLRAKAPQAEIYVLNLYNVYQLIDPQTEVWIGIVNGAIAEVAQGQKTKLIDVHAILNGGGAATLCSLTHICTDGDSHPNNAGYAAIADAICNSAKAFPCNDD
jgi:lysophospholipase L1-like esterase